MDPEARRSQVRLAVNRLRRQRRAIAIAYLGGVCVQCGGTDRLEFDHIVPARKHKRLAKMWTAAADKLWVEIDKCQLLCHTCHRAKTLGDGSFGEWGKDS